MTNVLRIQAGVNDLIARMLAKGLVKPDGEFRIIANSESCMMLSWEKEGADRSWDRHYVYHRGDYEKALGAAREAIAILPDKATRDKEAFLSKLDEVIALGRKSGIEVDFVNPLVETMKRLSENIITHRKAGA
jgi:hypothetical protein